MGPRGVCTTSSSTFHVSPSAYPVLFFFGVFPLSFSFLVKNLANVRGPKGLYAASKGSLVIAKEE